MRKDFGTIATSPSYKLEVEEEKGLKNMERFPRITFNSSIMQGQACIRGMRIPVSLIVNLVAHGKSTEQILSEYPTLVAEDVRESLEYAAVLTRDEVYVG